MHHLTLCKFQNHAISMYLCMDGCMDVHRHGPTAHIAEVPLGGVDGFHRASLRFTMVPRKKQTIRCDGNIGGE